MRISKKILAIALSILMAVSMMPFTVFAATTVATINSEEFTSLADAIASVSSGSATIELVNDADVASTIAVDNGVKYTINMNGNTISSTTRVFNIRHGGVTLSGTGIVNATFTNANSAVAVYGSTSSSDSNYSTFSLGSDVTINAPNGYGAMIGANGNASFGAVVTINGTINSKYGVYVNGNVAQTDSENAAKFNVYGTVTANNENAVVYAAGYANWTIGTSSTPAVLTGGSGIYIKSGNMTVTNATVTANGAKTDYAFNGNGANGTGDAIIIDSCGYPGSVPTVTINGGTITSVNGKAVASYAKQDDPRYTDAEFPRVDEVIPATSTAVFSSDVSALAEDGYKTVYNSEKGGYVVAEDNAVAEVNGVKYDTFEEALAAISDVTTATHSNAKDPTYQYKTYVANGTIKLLANTTSNGVIIGSGSNLTIDFNGKTLDINAKPVGSNGTESSAMQLLKDSDITFKNGTLTSTYTYASTDTEYIQRLIQNYANLTLDHMTVGMRGNFKNQLMMSNSNGNITITGSTVSAPDFSWANYSAEQAAESLGARAMSVGTFSTYTGVNVTVTDSTINGYVNIDNTGENGTAALTLNGSDVKGNIVDKSMNGSTVTNNSSTVDGIPAGYEWVDNGDGTSSLAEDTHSVAEVNGAKYDTFEDALAAISDVTTATHSNAKDPTYQYKTYVANGTIKLLQDCTTNGIIIGSGSDLTIDFNGKTLDITDKPVGSNGTETIGMQLLKDSDITFENGTLTSTADSSKKIVRLIQNYADLTLDNMTVGMKGNFYDQMTMSNCNGDITITGSTVSAPDFTWLGYTDEQAAESLGAVAMSVGTFSTYTGVEVTVTDSNIKGNVNIDNTGANGTAALTLDGGEVTGDIVDKSMNNSTVTNNGSTVGGIPEGYEWNASNVLAPIEDGFNLTVEDMIHMNLYVNADAYDADEITVTYSDPDKQNGGVKTETFAVSDLTQDDKGRYAVKILAAPAQMRDEVTVTAGSHTYTTTVAAYCEALIAQSNDAELVALAKAMLDYGKACSDEFNYNESAFASQAYYNTDDVTTALNNAAIVNTSSANGQFTSYAYIAKSVPALRIYLNTTEAEAAALGGNAIVDGEATQIMVDPNGNVCVDITGIRAEDLNKEFAVDFNGGLIRINALQFAKAKGGDLGRSMYNYYTAAHAYFVN